jgi:hypothetical protein
MVRAMRSHTPRAWLRSIAVFAALVAPGCGGQAAFPDQTDLAKAQASYCEMLARTKAGGEHLDECRSARPTASPAFLRELTGCYEAKLTNLGEEAPDPGQIVSECKDEALLKIAPDDANTDGIVFARCARQERCEKVNPAECRASYAKLETSQRALLSTMYNGAALHDIADCLTSTSCKDIGDEERCYAPSSDKIVWFPR